MVLLRFGVCVKRSVPSPFFCYFRHDRYRRDKRYLDHFPNRRKHRHDRFSQILRQFRYDRNLPNQTNGHSIKHLAACTSPAGPKGPIGPRGPESYDPSTRIDLSWRPAIEPASPPPEATSEPPTA